MDFDPVAYSRMLDESLGVAGVAPQRAIGVGPEIGARVAAAPTPAPLGQPAPTPTIDGGAPAPAAAAANQPGKIQGQPPFKIQYKKGALEKVQNTGDLINAMKPASQRQYMDWWEQQYGAINERYNDLQRQLGRRPNADGDLSRKEQFRMLMEFGMELMARAGRGEPGAGGVALANSYDRAMGRKKEAVGEHDARSALIEKSRGEQLKGIGSYGDALKGQSALDQDAVQMQEAEARMKAAGLRKPEIISADQGTFDYDPETRTTTPITGIDGKPLTNLKVGARGGTGRDTRTANQKNIEDLVGRGVPEQLAVDIVYRRISDPQKAWDALYRDRRRQYASEEEAREETDRIIELGYGSDWRTRPKNARIDKSDPLGLRD